MILVIVAQESLQDVRDCVNKAAKAGCVSGIWEGLCALRISDAESAHIISTRLIRDLLTTWAASTRFRFLGYTRNGPP